MERPLYNHIKQMVEESETPAGKAFDYVIQILIIISLLSFSIETLPGLSVSVRKVLHWIEFFTVAIFSIEYILRLVFADKKFKFMFSFHGIIDLLAILPFYLSTGIDLRSIRIFRLLRLLRILKIFRYNEAIQKFRDAFLLIRAELCLFGIATAFLLYIAAVGIYYFENPAQPEVFKSIFHSLWWAVATLTTVGYGDIYPITIGGKLFTFIMLMLGLGIIAVPTGLISSALSTTSNKE